MVHTRREAAPWVVHPNDAWSSPALQLAPKEQELEPSPWQKKSVTGPSILHQTLKPNPEPPKKAETAYAALWTHIILLNADKKTNNTSHT